jgi:integrase
MASRKAKSRIYWREQGGERRAYADFRDLGGGREALVNRAAGEKRATTDRVVAESLVAKRLTELVGRRTDRGRDAALRGVRRRERLRDFVAHHLIQKAKSGRFSETWLADSERMLTIAVEHFGAERELSSIEVADVQAWLNVLAAFKGRRGKTLSDGSRHHYLAVLSNLYKRAQSEGCVPPGFNPVAALMDKPTGKPQEARWLEVPDAALLLESARTYKSDRPWRTLPFLYPLVATYLLTGARESEALGLEVGDVNFERKTITFRPNAHRGLKTRTSHRTVPLWPQLEGILREHLRDASRVGGLLFPSPRMEGDAMITDFRSGLDAVAERAGWKEGEIRSKMFRHTYCAARLQTLDKGAPVSVYTVAKELGHGGDALVKRVYGHLGEIRHRSEVVEYRVEQHAQHLGTRLVMVRSA